MADLHVVGLDSDGKLRHTIRFSDPPHWQPFWDEVQAEGSINPGYFMDVACAGVGGDLHIVGVTDDGKLWHTIPIVNGTWHPSWGDVLAQEANNPAKFTAVVIADLTSEVSLPIFNSGARRFLFGSLADGDSWWWTPSGGIIHVGPGPQWKAVEPLYHTISKHLAQLEALGNEVQAERLAASNQEEQGPTPRSHADQGE